MSIVHFEKNAISDFFRRRTRAKRTETGKTVTAYDSARAEWEEKMRPLDRKCRKRPISRMFDDMAALWVFGAGCGLESISRLTDFTGDMETLSASVSAVTGVKLEKDAIRPAFDFDSAGADGEDVTARLTQLIGGDLLDEETALEFAANAFRHRYFNGSMPAPAGVDMLRVLDSAEHSAAYRDILLRHERMHTLYLMRLSADLRGLAGEVSEDEREERLSAVISASFTETMTALPGADEKYRLLVWMKFVRDAMRHVKSMPQSLTDFVDAENYRQVTSYLQTFSAKLRRSKTEAEHAKNLNSFIEAVFTKILEEIDPHDAPCGLLLGNIMLDAGEFARAREYFTGAAAGGGMGGTNAVMATITSYEKEAKELKRKLYRSSHEEGYRLRGRIKEINSELSRTYREFEYELRRMAENAEDGEARLEFRSRYAALVAKYARHEKDCRNYESCYELLMSVPEDYPNRYRIYGELGMLYQTPGSSYRANKYYDGKKAIETLRAAMSLLEAERPDNKADYRRSAKGILIPLANTCYTEGLYDDALKVCRQVLSIDGEEKKAKEIIERLKAAEQPA